MDVSTAEKNLSPEVREQIGKAIGRIASGVYIVTCEGSERNGMLATWVIQSGFEPPSLTVAINKNREILQSIEQSGKFTINILAKNNMEIFKAFARPYQPGQDRFGGITIEPHNGFGPALSDTIAYLNCSVQTSADAGDHIILVGKIVHAAVLNPDGEPMIHLRKNGFQY